MIFKMRWFFEVVMSKAREYPKLRGSQVLLTVNLGTTIVKREVPSHDVVVASIERGSF